MPVLPSSLAIRIFLILRKSGWDNLSHSEDMIEPSYLLSLSSPLVQLQPGAVLLERGVMSQFVHFIETGSVVLGVGANKDAKEPSALLSHQLGLLNVPGWLEAGDAVLELPSLVDALAQTSVTVRRVPLPEFQGMVGTVPLSVQTVLQDIARSHRQQMELAISRVAKDAEARCAEWLLSQAQTTEKGICSVMFLQRKRMIAAQLGIAPETLSRALRHLRERRLISGSGRVVNLVDPSGLRSLAGA